ncbi:MAG TPA: beta-propeller fold lactonase family protein [Terriglobales bacterium]|jgi:6-phosphogluconolactonase (cycloisomerase 2 family)|nr:beta-propeller fold lactonase family protein [Terriglobales bacterium]
MRLVAKPLLALALLVALAGCGDFFVDDTPTNQAKFAFVANNGSGNASAYTVGSNGALANAPGSPFGAATNPNAIDADGSGRWVYVANNAGGISGYTINRNDGSLGAVSGSPFTPGTGYLAIAVDPAGRFVYALTTAGSVESYTLNNTSGVITIVGTAVPVGGALANAMVEDPSGHFVFVAVGAAGVVPLKIQTDGTLVAGAVQPPAPCTGANRVAISPNARFAYITDGTSVCIFSVNNSNGALTAVTGGTGGSPVAAGTTPTGLAVDETGKFLYVTNAGSNNVTAFTVASDGRLATIAGSPFAAGASPVDVNSDPSGQFLYVVNNGGGVQMYTINTTSGVLTDRGTTSAGTSPVAIVTTP